MTKIALVLGGGVSLGSYIGGAVTELLHALQNNKSSAGPVRVHVVTGTSSGALNAAMAARTLAVNARLLPWIEKAWVDAADAEHLLNANRPNRGAWLDDSAIEELSRALIAGDPAAEDGFSPIAGDPLRVGVTLANLYGVRYDMPYGFLNVPERSFGTRDYEDAVSFEFSRTTKAGDPAWEALRQAALASSAFPFAFPVRSLQRSRGDYPGATLPGGGDDLSMFYVDGGLFDTAPLGLAKRLVEKDRDYRSDDWRYILVEPTLRSSQKKGPAELTQSAPGALVDLAADLSRAVLGQGAAEDWVRANRINARLEVLSALVERLPELNDRLHDPDEVGLGRRIGELAERVAEMHVAMNPRMNGAGAGDPAGDYLDAEVARIEVDERYRDTLDSADSRSSRSRLAKLVFLLESAGGLSGKDIMKLYLVAPTERGDLAGDFLGNFGGFLNRSWRANDFRAGRRDAHRMLRESLSDIVAYDPGPEEEYHVEDIDPDWSMVPASARRRLETVLEAEANGVLADLRPGGLAGLMSWAWKPVLRRWMVERATRALQEAR
ncbi:MAG: DUF3376 domain-containing protein [Gemmatimonadota bacterium]